MSAAQQGGYPDMRADPESRELAARVMLTEYEQLKEEQRSRISTRDNLIYAVLIASAAVASATVANGSVYLLLLPPGAVLLGWAYLMNDVKVSQLGRYLQAELGPAVAALIPDEGVVFGWERRTDPRRNRRKRLQLGADLLAFCLLPVAALIAYWAAGPLSVPLVAVSVLELAGVGLLAVEIARVAEVGAVTWRLRFGRLAVYLEPRNLLVGVSVAAAAVYVRPLPGLVLRWSR